MIIENGHYSVYAHINKLNGKIYVGVTSTDPKTRWKNGKAYRENGHMYNAFKKYGWDNFEHEIIASMLTKEEALHMEKLLIENLDLKNPQVGYNMIDGGSLPPHYAGKEHPNYGKPLPKLTRQHISEARKGQNLGRKHSEETKEKIRQSRLGKPHLCSEDRKKKVSERMTGANNPRAKQVVCIETGQVFQTAIEASMFIGKSKGAVKSAIHTNTKAAGYTWKYL